MIRSVLSDVFSNGLGLVGFFFDFYRKSSGNWAGFEFVISELEEMASWAVFRIGVRVSTKRMVTLIRTKIDLDFGAYCSSIEISDSLEYNSIFQYALWNELVECESVLLKCYLERWTSGRKSLSITFNDVSEGFTLLLSNYFQSLKNLICFCTQSVKIKLAKLFGSYSNKGASINYIDKKGGSQMSTIIHKLM